MAESQQRIATCIYCASPLVPTFAFGGSEWYCMECRRALPYMQSHMVPQTPELEREAAGLRAQFRDIAKDCIPYGSRLKGCGKCAGEDHLEHATEEEIAASEAAYAKLRS